MKYIRIIWFANLLFLFCFNSASSQNIAGGEILGTVNKTNNKLYTNLYLYTNCYSQHPVTTKLFMKCASSGLVLDSITLNMSAPVDVSGLCPNQCNHCSDLNCSFPYGYRRYGYSGYFDLTSVNTCQEVVVYFQMFKRSSTITTGSASSDFYLKSRFSLSNPNQYSMQFFETSPRFLHCRNQDYFENVLLISSTEQDSIVYEITSPKENASKNINYNASYSYDKPLSFWGFPNKTLSYPRGFHLDPVSGDFYFRPLQSQETPVAIKATIYNADGFVAEMTREWILNINNCNSNFSPSLSGPFYYQVCSFSPKQFTVSAGDFDVNDSLLFDNSTNFNYKLISQDYSNPNNPKQTIEVLFGPNTNHSPEIVTLTVKDNKCPIQGSQSRAYVFDVIDGVFARTVVSDSSCGRYLFDLDLMMGDIKTIKWMIDSVVVSQDTSFYYQFYSEDTFYYSLELSGHNGCKYFFADKIITTITKPIVNAGLDDTVCFAGALYPLIGQPFPSMGHWQGNGVFMKDNYWYFNPSDSSVSENTSYELKYSYTSSNGCENSDSLNLYVLETPKPNLGASLTVCENANPVQLVGSPKSGVWSGAGVVNNIFDPDIGVGQYLLSYEVNTNGICPNSDTLLMHVAPLPEVHFSVSPINGEVPLLVDFKDSSMISSGNIATYHWNFGDGDISFQYGSVQHTYTKAGLFSVILFCESDQACQSFAIRSNIVNSWPVSIEEFKHNEVVVFPNPCSESLYIYSDEYRIQKVLLIDMLGNIVYTNSDISNNKTEIPPLNFKGLYILQVELISGENYFKPVLFN